MNGRGPCAKMKVGHRELRSLENVESPLVSQSYRGLTNTMADAVSLQEMEPSPVEETPQSFKDGSYFPDSSSSSSKGTHTLGLSGSHSTLWYLQRIQKYSTYAFSAFAAAHVCIIQRSSIRKPSY